MKSPMLDSTSRGDGMEGCCSITGEGIEILLLIGCEVRDLGPSSLTRWLADGRVMFKGENRGAGLIIRITDKSSRPALRLRTIW